MDLLQAIQERHSVRSYTDKKIEGEALTGLQAEIEACNRESGLHMQLCLNEPAAFSGRMARYGSFSGAVNYIAIVGPKGPALAEKGGYYGQRVVLKAQQLGLNTCWVAGTYSKGKTAATVQSGEKLLMVIAAGYGQTQGKPRKTKTVEELCQTDGPLPDWFHRGMEAAQLAPTAINQQKFKFILAGDSVRGVPGTGFYAKTDLGIAKYHFEIGAGPDGWHWAE